MRLFVLFLEYGWDVRNYAILRYLSDELEIVKKRAMRIILTGNSYDEPQLANFTILSDRRNKMCIKTLQKNTKGADPLAEHVTAESRTCAQHYQISWPNILRKNKFFCHFGKVFIKW